VRIGSKKKVQKETLTCYLFRAEPCKVGLQGYPILNYNLVEKTEFNQQTWMDFAEQKGQ
jgi:hypothetical protein